MNIDHVSKALEYVLKLNNVCVELSTECANVMSKKNFDLECGEAIARRADDVPQLVYSLGLVPTLTLLMSKVEDWLIATLLAKYLIEESIDVKKLVDWINRYSEREARHKAEQRRFKDEEEKKMFINEESKRFYNSVMKKLCKEFSASASAGYAAMLSTIIAYLNSIQKLDRNVIDSVNKLVSSIESGQPINKQVELGFVTSLAQYLLKMRGKEELVAMPITISFLLEFKKLAKAILEKEK